MAVLPGGKGKRAVTDFQTVMRFGGEYTLCKFDLQTGRTHQIRVHAKHLGHPVACDPVYGYKKQKLRAEGQLLHAYRLELTHPSNGERMTFTASLPPVFADILKKLCKQYEINQEELSYLFHAENH
jgi:23S rRNA pseudouridine1911/1915/1917 synthase